MPSGSHLLVFPAACLYGYVVWRAVHLRLEHHLTYPQALALGTLASLLLLIGLTPVAVLRGVSLAGAVLLSVWIWRYGVRADRRALRQMDIEECARLQANLAEDPGDARTRAALAHRLFQSGQYQAAISHLERASADCPEMSREWNRTLGQWRRVCAGDTARVCPICGAALDAHDACTHCGIRVPTEHNALLTWLLSPQGIRHRTYRPLYAAAAVLAALGITPERWRTPAMGLALLLLAGAVVLVLEVFDRK